MYAIWPIIDLNTKKPLNINKVAPNKEVKNEILKFFLNKKNIPKNPKKEK